MGEGAAPPAADDAAAGAAAATGGGGRGGGGRGGAPPVQGERGRQSGRASRPGRGGRRERTDGGGRKAGERRRRAMGRGKVRWEGEGCGGDGVATWGGWRRERGVGEGGGGQGESRGGALADGRGGCQLGFHCRQWRGALWGKERLAIRLPAGPRPTSAWRTTTPGLRAAARHAPPTAPAGERVQPSPPPHPLSPLPPCLRAAAVGIIAATLPAPPPPPPSAVPAGGYVLH